MDTSDGTPVEDISNPDWPESHNSSQSGGSRNGIHRRTKSAAGMLQKLVNEGVVGDGVPPQGTASPAKKIKRRESEIPRDEDEALI